MTIPSDGNENWKAIEGWPYEVSDHGRVRRTVARCGAQAGKILRPGQTPPYGHRYVTLYDRERRMTAYVHALVCAAFNGPKPTPRHEVAHWDGNPDNNKASNLRWATHIENYVDQRRHGRTNRGRRNGMSKLTEDKVKEMRQRAQDGETADALAAAFGLDHPNSVHQILRRDRWKHI